MNTTEISPLVYVSCNTYNHVKYIKDALDGFCMQQTDFPFVCGIIDDASTDEEPKIIQEYLEKNFEFDNSTNYQRKESDDYICLFIRHKINKNCYFGVIFLKYNHYSIKKSKLSYVSQWRDNAKYIALCEGDDYWIDPLKLQKQVDFMESHPNHSLCFCANECLYKNGKLKIYKPYKNDIEQCNMKDIILGGGGFMATCSMFYRQSKYIPYKTWAINCPIGDAPLMLTLSVRGFVGYLSDVMCVYRVMTSGGWSSGMTSNIKKKREHRIAMIRMWQQFDVWTNNKYHDIIRRKIQINNIHFIIKISLVILKTTINRIKQIIKF